MSDADFARERTRIEAETGLPCADPIRDGVDRFITALDAAFAGVIAA
jgi:uncharacterized NAD-dependent epimerase/dehydratase family protein